MNSFRHFSLPNLPSNRAPFVLLVLGVTGLLQPNANGQFAPPWSSQNGGFFGQIDNLDDFLNPPPRTYSSGYGGRAARQFQAPIYGPPPASTDRYLGIGDLINLAAIVAGSIARIFGGSGGEGSARNRNDLMPSSYRPIGFQPTDYFGPPPLTEQKSSHSSFNHRVHAGVYAGTFGDTDSFVFGPTGSFEHSGWSFPLWPFPTYPPPIVPVQPSVSTTGTSPAPTTTPSPSTTTTGGGITTTTESTTTTITTATPQPTPNPTTFESTAGRGMVVEVPISGNVQGGGESPRLPA